MRRLVDVAGDHAAVQPGLPQPLAEAKALVPSPGAEDGEALVHREHGAVKRVLLGQVRE